MIQRPTFRGRRTSRSSDPEWPQPYEFIHKVVTKEAWWVRARLPSYSYLHVEDLIQEGLVVATKLRAYYQPARGRFTTLLTQSVRNRYADLLTSEWRKYSRMTPVAFERILKLPVDPGADSRRWAELELVLALKDADPEVRLEFDKIRAGLRDAPLPRRPLAPALKVLRARAQSLRERGWE